MQEGGSSVFPYVQSITKSFQTPALSATTNGVSGMLAYEIVKVFRRYFEYIFAKTE